MGNSPTGLFWAKVKPTQREKTYLNKDHYDLWVAVGKQFGDVKCGYCTCIGGADGACRHLAAVLYEIEAFEVKSVTDGDNQWKKRPRQHDCPVPIKRLKIAKPNMFEMNIQHKDDEGFDPRADQQNVDAEKMEDFANALKKISPSIQALDLLQTSFECDVMAEVDQRCIALSMEKKCKQFVQHHNYNFLSDVPHDVCQQFVEKLCISDKDIDDIQTCTIGQSKNPNWVIMRKGVVTASNFRKVCECVHKDKNPPSLRKTLLGQYGEAHSAPLKWGRNKEQCAMKMYNQISKKTHVCPKFEMQGLKMNKEKPFVGCSVDGILNCKCKDHDNIRVVEIKCPYSDRDKLPKVVTLSKGCKLDENGKFYLSKESEYYMYHQVQGQMGIYSCQSADLVIHTKLGIQVVEDIKFDSIFFRNMMSNIEFYFKNVLLKEMLIKHD